MHVSRLQQCRQKVWEQSHQGHKYRSFADLLEYDPNFANYLLENDHYLCKYPKFFEAYLKRSLDANQPSKRNKKGSLFPSIKNLIGNVVVSKAKTICKLPLKTNKRAPRKKSKSVSRLNQDM